MSIQEKLKQRINKPASGGWDEIIQTPEAKDLMCDLFAEAVKTGKIIPGKLNIFSDLMGGNLRIEDMQHALLLLQLKQEKK